MFCPKCGAKVDDDSKFCTECGTSLEQAAKIVDEMRSKREADAEGTATGPETSDAETAAGCEDCSSAAADTPEVSVVEPVDAVEEPASEDTEPDKTSQHEESLDEAAPVELEGAIGSESQLDASAAAVPAAESVQASTSASIPAQSQPEAPKKKEPKAFYVFGIVVGLVAIALMSWQLFFNKPAGNTATFGQKDPIVCTVETKISPTDKDGKKLTSYTVELVGENDYTAKAKVTGEGGFSLSTFNDAKPGTYTLKVTNKKSQVEYGVPVKIVKKGQAQETAQPEVTIQVPESKTNGGASGGEGDSRKNDVSGNAKNVIQLGKMVGMNSTDLASCLKEGGAAYTDGNAMPYQLSSEPSWTISFDSAVSGLDKSIALASAGDQSNQPTELAFGSMLSQGYEVYGKLDSHQTNTTPVFLSQSDLEGGASFDDAVLVGLPIIALDDTSIGKLLDSCCLPSAGMQKFQFDESSVAVSWTTTTWTGIINSGGKTRYWIVCQQQYSEADYPATTTVACVSDATASDIVERADLGLSDTWANGSGKQKLDALAKAFTQDAGNGGMRTNVLTGEQEEVRE